MISVHLTKSESGCESWWAKQLGEVGERRRDRADPQLESGQWIVGLRPLSSGQSGLVNRTPT